MFCDIAAEDLPYDLQQHMPRTNRSVFFMHNSIPPIVYRRGIHAFPPQNQQLHSVTSARNISRNHMQRFVLETCATGSVHAMRTPGDNDSPKAGVLGSVFGWNWARWLWVEHEFTDRKLDTERVLQLNDDYVDGKQKVHDLNPSEQSCTSPILTYVVYGVCQFDWLIPGLLPKFPGSVLFLSFSSCRSPERHK
ncbi:hypothetical protein CSKR_102890 [Clonorchis sinensis]|uniref:Uncharacterized protein n=1 Tax=Clonorchis sinensis TaxID=79923 RepID=A0A3R7CII0_CLOSI|nr:hypothetical protein CSKR_102890 [Clonorchis sinensis]